MELSTWQRLRTRVYLFSVGVLRHVTVGTRVALIEGDRVLLVRQTYVPGWHFPGGGVEPGETAEASAAREVLEETGMHITAPMQLHGLYLNVSSTTNRDHIAFFVSRGFEVQRPFAANREIAEIGWFARDALPPTITPPTGRRVAEVFADTRPDAMW